MDIHVIRTRAHFVHCKLNHENETQLIEGHTQTFPTIVTQNTKANWEPKKIENNPQRLVTKRKSRANREFESRIIEAKR
jgi:hypothetical protein